MRKPRLLGKAISVRELLETIARLTGFEGHIVWKISTSNPSLSSGWAASRGRSWTRVGRGNVLNLRVRHYSWMDWNEQ